MAVPKPFKRVQIEHNEMNEKRGRLTGCGRRARAKMYHLRLQKLFKSLLGDLGLQISHKDVWCLVCPLKELNSETKLSQKFTLTHFDHISPKCTKCICVIYVILGIRESILSNIASWPPLCQAKVKEWNRAMFSPPKKLMQHTKTAWSHKGLWDQIPYLRGFGMMQIGEQIGGEWNGWWDPNQARYLQNIEIV